MNKCQHSAHPVLLIGERCVKRCRHLTCSLVFASWFVHVDINVMRSSPYFLVIDQVCDAF